MSSNDMTELLAYSRASADESDRATAVEAAAVMGGVSDVLARMQGEGQDDCEECGIEIPAARRRAAPWAVCCVECASIRERRA